MPKEIFKHCSKYPLIYAAAFGVVVGCFFLSWPIFAGDTDLWYHLSGGRYFFEHKTIPDSSYFSFIEPAKTWTNYYWAFQVFVFKIHKFSDYYGLIVLRALVYLCLLAFTLKLIKGHEKSISWASAFLFILIGMLLIPRFQLVRPHMFSYLFLAVFLYFLEMGKRRAFCLPILTVAWVNLHGMEYPVILAVVPAYGLEFMVTKWRHKTSFTRHEFFYLGSLLLSIAAILLTPHGLKMLNLPFSFPEHAFQFINEMRRLQTHEFLSLQIVDLVPTHATLFNLYLSIALSAFVVAILQKRQRLSHLLLLASGLLLLSKGLRFKYEFALLALPLIKSQIETYQSLPMRIKGLHFGKAAAVAVLAVIPFLYLNKAFSNRPKYPFSAVNLPEGTTQFLKQIKVGGKVLNMPEVGGYLQWQLYPEYKIGMDLQMSLFDEYDYFSTVNAFSQEAVLGKMVSRYHPSFILAYRDRRTAEKVIAAFPQYQPIFFDDTSVLYASARQQPSLVEKYRLQIDPYKVGQARLKNLTDDEEGPILSELLRLHAIWPHSGEINETIAQIYKQKQDAQKALPYADQIIDSFPHLAKGYQLKAELLLEMKSYDEAADLLQASLKKSGNENSEIVWKQLWFCYSKLQRHEEAYGTLKKAVNPFSLNSGYEDIFNLASSALMIGKTTEGRQLLDFAFQKVPAEDSDWQQRILGLLSMLESKKQ